MMTADAAEARNPIVTMAPARKRAPLHEIRMAETVRNNWAIVADRNITMKEVLAPGYLWSGFTQDRIAARDVVEIHSEDKKFFVRLYVVGGDAPTQSVLFHILESHDWGNTRSRLEDISAAVARDRGPGDRWCLMNGNEFIERGFDDRAQAEAWRDEQVRRASAIEARNRGDASTSRAMPTEQKPSQPQQQPPPRANRPPPAATEGGA